MDSSTLRQDELYASAAKQFGPALSRLVYGYECDVERRRDLLQEIHIELWRSFAYYEARASVRTWVYRIAHNVAAKHILKERRMRVGQWVDLDEALSIESPSADSASHEHDELIARLMSQIHQLKAVDRQLMLLYLDDMDAESIGEIAGMSAGAVATKIHRIKALLAKRFNVRETL